MGKYCLIIGILMLYTRAQETDSPGTIVNTGADVQSMANPQGKPSLDRWFSQDKFLHFSACAAISGLTYHVSLHRFEEDIHRGRVYSVSITALIGIGKELYDKKRKNHFSWKDLFWDGLGIGVGYLVFIR